MNTTKKSGILMPVIVCSPAIIFFVYEFVIQVAPGAMTQELMRDLVLGAGGLGVMAAAYFFAYTGMQIPMGLLYDRFGARSLMTLTVFICALGSLLFAFSDGIKLASFSRFLMGFGSSFSYIGVLVLIARWFPPKYFAALIGLAQAMSSVGAIIGETPMAVMVSLHGWRTTAFFIAWFGFFLSLVVWLVVRDSPEGHKSAVREHVSEGELNRLYHICKESQTWLIALYSFAIWSPIIVFATLWGGPFLMKLYGINAAKATFAVAWVWVGIGVGSPLAGWVSDYVHRRCIVLNIFAILGVISACAALYIPMSYFMMTVVLFIFGFAAGGQSLSFALIKDNNHPSRVGTAIGFNNTAVVMGGVLFQPFVGYLLELTWNNVLVDGAPVYSLLGYRMALSVLPICYIISYVVSLFFLKESYCKARYPL